MKTKYVIFALALVAVAALFICCDGLNGIGSTVSVSGCKSGSYVQQMGARADSLVAQNPNRCYLMVEWEGDDNYKVVRRTSRNCGRGMKANVQISGNTIKLTEHETGSGPLTACMCPVDIEVRLTDVEPGTYKFVLKGYSSDEVLLDLNSATDTVVFVGGTYF